MNDPISKMGSINQTKNKSLIREKWKKTTDNNSDEDLEELQKKFFSSKLQPAATISKSISDSNTSHGSRNQLNVNNSKDISSEYSEKFPQEEPVDSLLESSMPAAQLIIGQNPPEVKSSRSSLNNSLDKNFTPLKNSISSIVKQKTKYSKTLVPKASEPKITNNEKIIPNPNIPLESKDILFPGFSSNKVEESPVKNISKAQDLNSNNLKSSLSSKPIQKMSLFAKRRLLEKADPTFKAASKAGENIKIPKDIKSFLTSKIPENDVSNHVNNDFIINPNGFPKNFKSDYTSKANEIPDISNFAHNDQGLPRVEKPSKKTVTFDISPSYHDSSQNLNLDNNIDKISNMSTNEIVDAKEEIESLLNPKNIDFLLKRNNTKNSHEKNSITDIPAIENLDESLQKTLNEALKKLNKKELKVDQSNNQVELNALKNNAEFESSPKNDKGRLKISSDVDSNIEIETLISRNQIGINQKNQSESFSEGSKLNSNDFKSSNINKEQSLPQISDNDTDFYKKLKKIYFESEVDETDKLEWITSFSQAKSPSERVLENLKEQSDRVAKLTRDLIDGKETSLIDDPTAHLRFDFNGTLVDVLDDIPTYEGLHHHGENPDSAGYTIPELLHLSRSTVSGQRAIANKLIGNILHNINVLAFSETDSHAIYMCWLDWEGYLYFVSGWTDTYLTVQIEAIKSAWTWVVGMDQSKKLLSRSNNINSSFSAKSEAITKTFQALDRFLDILLDNSQSIISELYTDRIPIGCKRMIFEIINTLNRYSDDFSIKLKTQQSLLSTIKDLNKK
ncbi:RNA polymerase II-associated protein rba50 [Smittium culicis]|uniref:RNA polymerase II-associated protein rba50 n=1 Tax=Smittium culicis TaxID=133412 RepID=A0A1R1Y2G5_9FUNG|nr:RNA polymerase II-associated protein rba50 [Smittium culicis]